MIRPEAYFSAEIMYLKLEHLKFWKVDDIQWGFSHINLKILIILRKTVSEPMSDFNLPLVKHFKLRSWMKLYFGSSPFTVLFRVLLNVYSSNILIFRCYLPTTIFKLWSSSKCIQWFILQEFKILVNILELFYYKMIGVYKLGTLRT